MTYTRKENEAEARARLNAFWSGSSLGRPALHVVARDQTAQLPAWPGDPKVSLRNDYDPSWHVWHAECELRSTIYLAEAMPGITLRWGTLLTTVAMLAGAEYAYESGSAWIKEIPNLWDMPLPVFDPQGKAALALEDTLRAVAEAVGQRGYVSPPAMLDGLTTLSSFRTPERLCFELIERPEDVMLWNEALTDIYIAGYQHLHQFVTGLGYGETSTWLRLMAPGSFEAVQCDFAVMLSPAMFERFVLPPLVRTVESLDYALYHLDGTCQLRFLPLLRQIEGLHGIQWNPEPAAGSPTEWITELREIKESGLLLHITCETVDEARVLAHDLGPNGLYLILPEFESEEEAVEAIDAIRGRC